MLNPEFSNEFDVLYNNITSNQAPGLDEYEKSVFLTLGQDDVLRAYFNPRENKPQQGFDESSKRQIDFSALMKTEVLRELNTDLKFDSRSLSYRIPKDLLLFVNEACNDNNYRYVVIPISYNEYDRLMLKPYQYPIKRGIWRLIVDSTISSISKVSIPMENGNETFLSIENKSNKEVTFRITTTPFDIETVVGEDHVVLAKEGVGKAPVITETPTSVDIHCVISSSIDTTSTYWKTFLMGSARNPWVEAMSMYVGKFGDDANSIFPNISIAELGVGKSVTAPPVTPCIELIGKVDKKSFTYTVRYIRRPRPIILDDLGGDLSIRGVSTKSTCELDESLHQEILQRAVELAKASYTGDLQSQIALGQASKTDIGVIAQSR